MGLAYAGDKALTGVVNYYSNRAAIRSEMGRFDQRFGALRNDVLDSRTRILGGIEGSRTDVLAGITGSEGRILTGMGEAATGIVTGIGATETRVTGEVDQNQRLLEALRNLSLPLCSNPFGSTSQMPCRN